MVKISVYTRKRRKERLSVKTKNVMIIVVATRTQLKRTHFLEYGYSNKISPGFKVKPPFRNCFLHVHIAVDQNDQNEKYLRDSTPFNGTSSIRIENRNQIRGLEEISLTNRTFIVKVSLENGRTKATYLLVSRKKF